jgi:hypothetical protein
MKQAVHGVIYSLVLICTSVVYGEMEQKSTLPSDESIGKISDTFPTKITPDAGPRVVDGFNVVFSADFIYWTARMDGLGYAASGVTSNKDPVPKKGSIKNIDWEWDPGFKVGLGVNLPYDGWDLIAEYTWLRTKSSDRSSGVHDFMGLWSNPSFVVGEETRLFAKAHTDLHFNVIDLELGRNFFVSRFLALRPFIGVKGTWQDYDFRVKYQRENLGQHRVKIDQDYWGVGLRGGLDTA